MGVCKCIVVIEDDEGIRDLLREVLEMEGYHVETAENGRAGVQLLERVEKPCLILLDLMMPVMNGWEFLEAQREDVTLATIPVVVVSAAGEKAKDAGASGYIKKPVELEALIHMVRRYCKVG